MRSEDLSTTLEPIDSLEKALTQLVRTAPDLEASEVEAASRLALALAMKALAISGDLDSPMAVAALAIERVLDEVAAGRLDQGVALPSLAMAASALQQAADRPTPQMADGLRAATFELETMLPIPGKKGARHPPKQKVDVPLQRIAPKVVEASRAAWATQRTRRFMAAAHEADDDLLRRLAQLRTRFDAAAAAQDPSS